MSIVPTYHTYPHMTYHDISQIPCFEHGTYTVYGVASQEVSECMEAAFASHLGTLAMIY